MKKVIFPLVAALLVANGVTYADNNAAAEKATTANAANAKATPAMAADMIKLYAEPNENSAALTTLSINQRLIPIFQREGWIKVGNPADGSVGWINKDQYQKAMDSIIHQNMQTIYIEQIDQANKKPEITVYQNGKKLNGDEAAAVYANIEKQQDQARRNMYVFQHQMNSWMNQQMQVTNMPMIAIPAMPLIQPIVIVEKSAANANAAVNATATDANAKK